MYSNKTTLNSHSTQGAAAGPELDTQVGGESAGRLPESDSVVNATGVDPAVTVNVSVESSGQARAPVGDENTTEGPSAATGGVVEETVASVGVRRMPRTTRHEAETVMRIRALQKIRTGSVFQDGDRSNWNIFQGGWDLSSVFGTVALGVNES